MYHAIYPHVIVTLGNSQPAQQGSPQSYLYSGNRANSSIPHLANYPENYSPLNNITNLSMAGNSNRFSPPHSHNQNQSPQISQFNNIVKHGYNNSVNSKHLDASELIQLYSQEASPLPRRYMTSHRGHGNGSKDRAHTNRGDGAQSTPPTLHSNNFNQNNNYHKYNRNHNYHNNPHHNHNNHYRNYNNPGQTKNWGSWKRYYRNQVPVNNVDKNSSMSEELYGSDTISACSTGSIYDSDDSVLSLLRSSKSDESIKSKSEIKGKKPLQASNKILIQAEDKQCVKTQPKKSELQGAAETASRILKIAHHRQLHVSSDHIVQLPQHSYSKKSKSHHSHNKNSPQHIRNSGYNNRNRRIHNTAIQCYGNNPHYNEVYQGYNMPYSLNNLHNLHMYFHINPYSTGPFHPMHFYVPADRFMARAHLMQVKEEPQDLFTGDEFDNLSRSIWDKFMEIQQTESTFTSKMMLWKFLFLFIKNFYARYGLFVVGSTMTGLGANSSDIDLCMFIKSSEVDQRLEANDFLQTVLQLLNRFAGEFVTDGRLIAAKVPILKFRDLLQGLEVDLNCNNFVGVRNTHLLYCYSQMNWRLRPLVLIIKLWASHNKINSAMDSTISSYSITLMVIHYLQCGVRPAVLPCLHDLFPNKFDPYCDIHTIEMHEQLEPFSSDNKQSLGELFIGFLDYYAKFDYSRYAISVRLAKLLDIEECRINPAPKNEPNHWLFICIEEPFEFTNTARSVYNEVIFKYIKTVFATSYKRVKHTKDLNSLFHLNIPAPDFDGLLGTARAHEIRPKTFDSKAMKHHQICDSSIQIHKFDDFPPLQPIRSQYIENEDSTGARMRK